MLRVTSQPDAGASATATETSVLDSLDIRLARIEGALPCLATKEDISDLRGEMHTEISAQGSDLRSEIAAPGNRMDAGTDSLRGEMGKMNGGIGELRGDLRTMRWTMIRAVSLIGAGPGVLMFVLN